MQKLTLKQSLLQKLSPQQIQFIKLLQVPTAELEARIKEELEVNPALEEGLEREEGDEREFEGEKGDEDSSQEEVSIDDYLNDDYSGYKMQGDGPSPDDDDKESPISSGNSMQDNLLQQLGFLPLDERRKTIAKQIIGSVDADGYVRRELEAIANDLAFTQNIETDEEELEQILKMIQHFDPPGIGARSLQECLLIQLERKEEHSVASRFAIEIIEDYYDEFIKKHYDKILKKSEADDEILKEAVQIITKLNPKPGGTEATNQKTQYIIPDFILNNINGKLELSLNSKNAPDLRISPSYTEMFDAYDKSDKKDKKLKQTVAFVKQKLDAAKWFIDAIKQRQITLMKTMQAIIDYQHNYFQEGDESELRPMILKDIAERINMDISTVSRIANSKYVQTEFGILPLKYFFSEGLSTDSGEDVSSREVKSLLKKMIEDEDKKKPLSDDKLEKMLKSKGYQIARRTVAKYREQMNIPVARLRKKL